MVMFMCSVDGMNAPKKEYHSYSEARTEAERLASLRENLSRNVRVLHVVDVIRSVPVTQEVYTDEDYDSFKNQPSS